MVARLLLCGVLAALPSPSAAHCPKLDSWDEAEEAQDFRGSILPRLTSLPDYAKIRDAYEAALRGDRTAVALLADLSSHPNSDAAKYAVMLLGRFPGSETGALLNQIFEADTRTIVRLYALNALVRIHDPQAGPLAVRALSEGAPEIQAGGLVALDDVRDSQYSAAVLAFHASHSDDEGVLETLGCLGDPPGSTAVRDRLLAEANKKTNRWVVRLAAAEALEDMGQADLVRRLLDSSKAEANHQSLLLVVAAVRRLALARGVTVKSQADVDTLLKDADIHRRLDEWDRPIRAKFMSVGVFIAVSDGPDRLPDTSDDMSSAEPSLTWVYRVFKDEFP